MRIVAAAFAGVCGVLSIVGVVLFAVQVHATRVFAHQMDTSGPGDSLSISSLPITTFSQLWLPVVLLSLGAIVLTLVAGAKSSLLPSVSAAGLVAGGAVLDFLAIRFAPGGFGNEFPSPGFVSGPESQFDAWGGAVLERGVWLTATAAVTAIGAALLILLRVKSTVRSVAMYAYPPIDNVT